MSSSKKAKKGRSEKREELNPEKNRLPVDMYCFSPIFINRITEVIQVFITGVPVATRLHGEMEVMVFAREHACFFKFKLQSYLFYYLPLSNPTLLTPPTYYKTVCLK